MTHSKKSTSGKTTVSVGGRIREERIKKGLTLKSVADKLGVKYQSVQAWESRKRKPKESTIQKISEVLGVSADYLSGRMQTSRENHESKIYFAKQPVFYVCDMKKCKNCAAAIGGPCHHTSDIRHAKYPAPHVFDRHGTFLVEKERETK